MESKITSSYALITGGSSGIGKCIAMEMAKIGYNIAIVALPNSGQENAIKVLRESYSVIVKSLEINMTEDGAISQISEWLETEKIQLQVLVNNAGMGYAQEFSTLKTGFISTLLDLNIKATTLLTHSILPQLIKHKQSYILNLSSAAAFYSMPYKSIYAASKGYVLSFSTSLREELKPYNVNVTAVCPAGVITSEEIRGRINEAGFMARRSALEPEEVAEQAVKALFKNKASLVPGKLATVMSWARFIVPSALQRKLIAKNFKK